MKSNSYFYHHQQTDSDNMSLNQNLFNEPPSKFLANQIKIQILMSQHQQQNQYSNNAISSFKIEDILKTKSSTEEKTTTSSAGSFTSSSRPSSSSSLSSSPPSCTSSHLPLQNNPMNSALSIEHLMGSDLFYQHFSPLSMANSQYSSYSAAAAATAALQSTHYQHQYAYEFLNSTKSYLNSLNSSSQPAAASCDENSKAFNDRTIEKRKERDAAAESTKHETSESKKQQPSASKKASPPVSKDKPKVKAEKLGCSSCSGNCADITCSISSVLPLDQSQLPMCLRGVSEEQLNLASLFNTLMHHKKCRRTRTVFSDMQMLGLEKRFENQKYLSTPDRIQLAESLGLSQLQVKTWYQNRRMKWKKKALKDGCHEAPTKPKGRPKKNSIPSFSDIIKAAAANNKSLDSSSNQSKVSDQGEDEEDADESCMEEEEDVFSDDEENDGLLSSDGEDDTLAALGLRVGVKSNR